MANKPQMIREEYIWNSIDALNLPNHPIISLIGSMLAFDPSIRISASKALQHVGFQRFLAFEETLNKAIPNVATLMFQ